jgi:hypothetical protein
VDDQTGLLRPGLHSDAPTLCVTLNHVFPSIAADKANNLYIVLSDGANSYYTSSSDGGASWRLPTDGFLH